ncbi:MAG: hypothetical protein A2Z01_04160 [Betaproteobacteria bacterium RBG_16_58_11]|nr:MAG: hypothetical protein A2Z01_04160 [Betaproteobacteria bacterium RBG_16_58_11]
MNMGKAINHGGHGAHGENQNLLCLEIFLSRRNRFTHMICRGSPVPPVFPVVKRFTYAMNLSGGFSK